MCGVCIILYIIILLYILYILYLILYSSLLLFFFLLFSPLPHSLPNLPSLLPIIFSSSLLFLSYPLPSYPNLSINSFYTCRHLGILIYIPSISHQQSDPACFIGWECRVVQFDKYVFVFEEYQVQFKFELVLGYCVLGSDGV